MVTSRNFHSYNDYFDIIMKDDTGKELTELLNSLTTNHTYFMREEEHFHYLKTYILPHIFNHYHHERDLRIWSAGCSSGQEPYTISMIVSDFIEQAGMNLTKWNCQMLATDISERALTKAVSGSYDIGELSDLPSLWLNKYFHKSGNEYTVKDSIKSQVVFRKFNLMNHRFPFKKKFHTIFCRNVMIYFDGETKNRLIDRFYDALIPGGYLLIGHSEFIDRNASNFEYVRPAVYQKPGGSEHDR